MRFIKLILILIASTAFSCKMYNDRQPGKRTDQFDNTTNFEKFEFQFQDFEIFYDKFISDSIYQLSKVHFPVKGVLADYEGEKKWTRETWPFMKWDLRKEIKNTDDSIAINQSKNRFFFGSYCRDCGFSFEMAFDKIDKEWYLTYRQENNY